jgi:hypothetical protein
MMSLPCSMVDHASLILPITVPGVKTPFILKWMAPDIAFRIFPYPEYAGK